MTGNLDLSIGPFRTIMAGQLRTKRGNAWDMSSTRTRNPVGWYRQQTVIDRIDYMKVRGHTQVPYTEALGNNFSIFNSLASLRRSARSCSRHFHHREPHAWLAWSAKVSFP